MTLSFSSRCASACGRLGRGFLHVSSIELCLQVGISSVWWEGNPCNMHLHDLAQEVKEGCHEVGLVGLRFNTIGVSDAISMGTDGMWYGRNCLWCMLACVPTTKAPVIGIICTLFDHSRHSCSGRSHIWQLVICTLAQPAHCSCQRSQTVCNHL